MMQTITPLILTYNEEANVANLLQCLTWAEKIIIIDNFSTDNTLDIVNSYPQVEVFQRRFDNHTQQWNYGLEKVKTEWTLSCDADYIINDKLISEIANIPSDTNIYGYFIKFKYCVYGKALRKTLLPPRLALFRTDKSIYINDGHAPLLSVDGETGNLSNYIYHDDRKSLTRWLWSQDCYMLMEAKKLSESRIYELNLGDRIRKYKFLAPFAILFYCLVINGGILDGWRGFYYALQRVLAEIILSLRLIESENMS